MWFDSVVCSETIWQVLSSRYFPSNSRIKAHPLLKALAKMSDLRQLFSSTSGAISGPLGIRVKRSLQSNGELWFQAGQSSPFWSASVFDCTFKKQIHSLCVKLVRSKSGSKLKRESLSEFENWSSQTLSIQSDRPLAILQRRMWFFFCLLVCKASAHVTL